MVAHLLPADGTLLRLALRRLARRAYVASHTANTHLIPASGRIASALAHVRRGDVVRLEGDLVDVSSPDGFVWKTSLSRTDTGPGACETLYVRAVTIGLNRYR